MVHAINCPVSGGKANCPPVDTVSVYKEGVCSDVVISIHCAAQGVINCANFGHLRIKMTQAADQVSFAHACPCNLQVNLEYGGMQPHLKLGQCAPNVVIII